MSSGLLTSGSFLVRMSMCVGSGKGSQKALEPLRRLSSQTTSFVER